MKAGEYAILYSNYSNLLLSDPDDNATPGEPFCSVFGSFADAEGFAAEQVAHRPTLECRIYDHHGLGQPPVLVIAGPEYKGAAEITPRFRRWWGYSLLIAGVVLVIIDWRADFGLLWPAMLGTRFLPIGLLLLVTELVLYIEAKRRTKR